MDPSNDGPSLVRPNSSGRRESSCPPSPLWWPFLPPNTVVTSVDYFNCLTLLQESPHSSLSRRISSLSPRTLLDNSSPSLAHRVASIRSSDPQMSPSPESSREDLIDILRMPSPAVALRIGSPIILENDEDSVSSEAESKSVQQCGA